MTTPFDRQEILGKKWKCACGSEHNVQVEKVLLGHGVVHHLPQLVNKKFSQAQVLIVSDKNTYEILGKQLAKILMLERIPVRELVLPGDEVVADDKTAADVLSEVKDETLLISCGSGTVTDLTKYAACQKQKPFIAVATAASMNGYTSNIVALLAKNLKRTIPARSPVAVVADLDIICAAPLEMTQAGLGDVISRSVSIADWKLASLVKKEKFCELPFEIIADLETDYAEHIGKLEQRDPEVIKALMEALIYSGISMVIAGSSAPASGGEHLISHTLDVKANLERQKHDFHGTQVGVATLITAQIYEKLLNFKPENLNWQTVEAGHKLDREAQIKQYWGVVAQEVLQEYTVKAMSWAEKKRELEYIINNWSTIISELKPFLSSAQKIKRLLTDGGAKSHYRHLGISKSAFHKAILMAPTMRSRYTVLDLAHDLGLLEIFIEEILTD